MISTEFVDMTVYTQGNEVWQQALEVINQP